MSDEAAGVEPRVGSRGSERYVVAARLNPGTCAEAERQLSAGPPFDPAEAGLAGHAAYLTDSHVYLEFDGHAARGVALRLAREHLVEVSRWQRLVADFPTIVEAIPAEARCLYRWSPRKTPAER